MALKDIIARFSPDAEKLFHHDPDASRRPVLDKIAKTREAFADPSKRAQKKWFTIGNNNIVAFEPKRADGQPIVIDGKSVTFWKADEFPAILDSFEAAVRAGEIDDQLEGGTPAGASLPEKTLRKPRQKREGGGSGWSEERRAKFAATVAARNAAK